MAYVASVGIFVNGFSGWIIMRRASDDINVKSAYIHLFGDALMSLGVVIGGVVISLTGYSIIDPLISVLVSIIMMVSIFSTLRESIRMNFDGIPASVDIDDIMASILAIEGVDGVHHLHIWALSTTENALSAHILLRE